MRWGIRIWNFIAVFSFDLNDGKLGSLFHITENKSLSISKPLSNRVCRVFSIVHIQSFCYSISVVFRFALRFRKSCLSLSLSLSHTFHIFPLKSDSLSLCGTYSNKGEHWVYKKKGTNKRIWRYCYTSFLLTIVTRLRFKYSEILP